MAIDPTLGIIGAIHTTKRYGLGTTRTDADGNIYVYMKGVASTVSGSWVTYDETFATALLVANAIGPVAISMSANTVATSYSWYQVYGYNEISKSDTTAADKPLYIDTTAGQVDDASVAGDMVFGAVSTAADTANVLPVFIAYPFVYDGAYLT